MNSAAVWRKASRSNTQGGDCVELASLDGKIGVRDSKAPEAGHLTIPPAELANLIGRIRSGDLDL